jgi:hypothetical protein
MALRRALASLLLVASAHAQDPPFVALMTAAPVPGRLDLLADLHLQREGFELFAVHRGERFVVPRTAPTGRVHAFTRDAGGTVFVGTDAGLFVLDAQHVVLDPADVRDGVPSGAVRGVYADGSGRLWLCTETAFGVVDPRFGHGRTFGAADGLPAGPFHGVSGGFTGTREGVVLWTGDRPFAYTPDRGDGPRARGGVVRAELTASADGIAPFTLDVEALGGPTLRQRRRHHHLLQPVDGGALRGLGPGKHVVEVHAIDRDLRRALVAEYTVTVPLPKALDPRVLPVAAGAVALLLLAIAFRSGPRDAGIARRLVLAAARTALLLVVGLQLLAACLGYGRSWPFVGFSMYTETYRESSVLHRPRIVATCADGSPRPLHEHEAGVVQDGYWQMLAEVVHGGGAAADAFLAQLRRRQPYGEQPYAGFVLGDGRIRLTADGPVDVAPTIFVRWPR